ncbi:hypothetical protein SCLCIDRAFT_1223588 [Scleroderma citrinum Foug A]|uniref:Uncharacterized protein n=1 Tax=Scleroderma citrinum Foug A TaxID=1036808 RepID=A0A0C3D8D7_9AGAM|nr:hypothetical protein SCLCIDRAFT_1223588 [Scleroderma citrinum Foug A]
MSRTSDTDSISCSTSTCIRSVTSTSLYELERAIRKCQQAHRVQRSLARVQTRPTSICKREMMHYVMPCAPRFSSAQGKSEGKGWNTLFSNPMVYDPSFS